MEHDVDSISDEEKFPGQNKGINKYMAAWRTSSYEVSKGWRIDIFITSHSQHFQLFFSDADMKSAISW